MDFLPPAKLPFIEKWIFFGSPVPLLIIFAVYFAILKFGPIYMKNRPAYKLKNVIRFYNLIQIFSCTLFSILARYKWGYNMYEAAFQCLLRYEDYIETLDEMIYIYTLYWYFFLVRLIELFETVFFILRKKQDQVSFLHIYHHTSTLVFLYILNRYSASPMEAFVAILNNNVHILMYTYYFFSSFGNLTKYTNVLKPLMTTIQIVQLIIILVQCLAARMCGSTNLFYVFSFNIAVLIFFFGQFYYKSYILKKKEGKVVKNE
ncbi:very long chain fatty acid elongase 7-like [Chironomus tepperi]|uniref:very long chain fatty acid elongase 7-like n=1 Tax=Chironomus tepperi TaxID=113505 RepID=UPI00391F730A